MSQDNVDAIRHIYEEWGRGRGSGVTVDTEGAHVWTLRDGKVVRLEAFADRAKALAAVGLKP